MLFGADPDVAVGPFAEVAELLDFGVRVLDVVFDGEAGRVVDADVAAEAEEDAGGFVGEELGVGSVLNVSKIAFIFPATKCGDKIIWQTLNTTHEHLTAASNCRETVHNQ